MIEERTQEDVRRAARAAVDKIEEDCFVSIRFRGHLESRSFLDAHKRDGGTLASVCTTPRKRTRGCSMDGRGLRNFS
jgi:hypothetical protein